MLCEVSLSTLAVDPGSKTHRRGSTLTGFASSSMLIVVSYRCGTVGWFEGESTNPHISGVELGKS